MVIHPGFEPGTP